MELRHLRYFAAVAETLNYRHAAQRLHVAQPTLSSQIKDLEAELGVRLFDRDTHGVQLTTAGAVFLEEIRGVFARLDQGIAKSRAVSGTLRPQLAIGYFAPILDRFMPPALAAFQKQFPDVDANLVELPIGEQIEAVNAGIVQIGFMLRNRGDAVCSLPHAPIATSAICAVVARGHPLARAKQVRLADLAGERLFCLASRKRSPREHLSVMRQIFAHRNLKTAPIRSVSGSEAFRATLESGLGVSLVLEIGSLSQSKQLVLKPLVDTGDDLRVTLLALWKNDPAPPHLVGFVACLRQAGVRERR